MSSRSLIALFIVLAFAVSPVVAQAAETVEP
jgi:hypothetical protein